MESAKRTALITGITGQDGSYLAEKLLERGYRVVGVTRDPSRKPSLNIQHLVDRLELVDSTYEQHSLVELLSKFKPNEVYNLTGQVYVSKSWEMVDETLRATAQIPAHLLEAIVRVDRSIRFFQASSSEIFYPNGQTPLTEESPLSPYNPYGCSKAYAHSMVTSYRKNYGIYAVNGVFFNHESPRRHENFAGKKAIHAAVQIKLGKRKELRFGNLDVIRDWGYAPDFVEAAWRMLQQDSPRDFLICSGASHSLRDMVRIAFEELDLDFGRHVVSDPLYMRLHEPKEVYASNEALKTALRWQPTLGLREMIRKIVQFELKMQKGEERDFSREFAI